jgi:small subunit ribosomal protein S14
MAKKSVVNREAKRANMVRKFAAKRKALKALIRDPNTDAEEREAAKKQFHTLPRDSGPSRLRNRCRITGRPKGYYRKFGLGRNMLREAAMRGDVPGLVKASW